MSEPELYTAEWFAQQEREAAERFPDHPAACMWHPRPNFVAFRRFLRGVWSECTGCGYRVKGDES